MLRYIIIICSYFGVANFAFADKPYIDPELMDDVLSGKSVRVIIEIREPDNGGPSSSASVFLENTLAVTNVNSIDARAAVT